MKVIQINLNHCGAAQDILSQTIIDEGADIILISEPYKSVDDNTWVSDKSRLAAIWTNGRLAFQDVNGQMEGFVRAKVKGIHFYSCYARPSWTTEEFQTMLENLVADARGRAQIVIGGDFNAWAVEWGSRMTNARGRILLETFASLNIGIANTGEAYTYRKAGTGSIIDVTFVSNSLLSKIKWQVSEEFSNSDHQAIIIDIDEQKKTIPPRQTGPKWKDNMFDKEIFDVTMENCIQDDKPAEEMAQDLTKCIANACDAAMPRRTPSRRGSPCYWWNDDIKTLRVKCLQARRISQRSRGSPNFQENLQVFEQARRELSKAIKKSKAKCFKDLCNEADVNPWGTAYRMVMSKLKGKKTPAVRCPTMLKNIVETLFPQSPTMTVTHISREADAEPIPTITEVELREACKKIKDRKTPGPDGVPNKALKAAIQKRPDMFIKTMQKCLDEGVFPDQWKLQHLVLLPKGNKPPDDPSSYRPICLLDTVGKILEKIIYNRLLDVAEQKGALSDFQFGFRKGRSTVDAIRTVVNIATEAIAGERWLHGSKQYCAVVTLDVKNAFNSANWTFIMRELIKMTTPYYLTRILADYFKNRRLRYDSEDGDKYHDVTKGVPQGSVIGPLVWNLMYNGVLRLKLPRGVKVVGFADDIGVVAVAKEIEEVEAATNEAIMEIKRWLESASLELADHKTEAVLITSRKKIEYMTIRVGEQIINSKESIKYLGVMLDNRLKFRPHIEYSSKKASQIQAALARIMPNIGGPGYPRRLLLARVVTSVLLYAAPVWAGALKTKDLRRKLNSTYRLSALRTISGFRTISDEAAYIIAAMIPIDIYADELQRIYARKTQQPGSLKAIKDDERTISMAKWQERWNNGQKGRWTYTLIPDIDKWINRSHGECNFQLTQFLTGHGGFRKYLHRFGHDNSALCPECPGQEEDAEHVIFNCRRFGDGRVFPSDPKLVISYILSAEDKWTEFCSYITNVQTELRRIEKLRRAETVNIVVST